jgi:hypothetical protein
LQLPPGVSDRSRQRELTRVAAEMERSGRNFEEVIYEMDNENFYVYFSNTRKEDVIALGSSLKPPKIWFSQAGTALTRDNFHKPEFLQVYLRMTDEEVRHTMTWFFPHLTEDEVGNLFHSRRAKEAKEAEEAAEKLADLFSANWQAEVEESADNKRHFRKRRKCHK